MAAWWCAAVTAFAIAARPTVLITRSVWRPPATIQLPAEIQLRAHISERDLHASGTAAGSAFCGRARARGHQHTPPLGVLATHGVANDFVNPLVHEGELTVERRLRGGFSLSAGYVFSRVLHLPVFVDANLAPPTTTESYAILNSAGSLVQNDYRAVLHPARRAIA
jgi:hypothetical protein